MNEEQPTKQTDDNNTRMSIVGLFYTGIGSRNAPSSYLNAAATIAVYLGGIGMVLRSGGAQGMDQAFERGANLAQMRNKESTDTSGMMIYLPWRHFMQAPNDKRHINTQRFLEHPDYEPFYRTAQNIISLIHPNPRALKPNGWRLHTRNVFQVLGPKLNMRSRFTVLWAEPQGQNRKLVKGGTNTAYVLSQKLGIPTYNLFFDDDAHALRALINELSSGNYDALPSFGPIDPEIQKALTIERYDDQERTTLPIDVS